MELTEEAKLKLEKHINSFSESYMNNSKWKRVFTELLKQKEIIQRCEIYDFLYSGINEINWEEVNNSSSESIFQDHITSDITTSEYPTYYKGIEYIEFPKFWVEKTKYNLIINKKNTTQDTEKIKEVLSKIGQFKWVEDEEALILIGYKK